MLLSRLLTWSVLVLAGCSLASVLLVSPLHAEIESEASRRVRLEKMSAEEKETLSQKKERFDALGKEEQQRLRDLHEAVATSDKSGELTGVMDRYYAWLKNLPANVRRDVLALPEDQRIAKIKEVLREQESQRFRQMAGQLPQSDVDAIFAWLEQFIEENQSRFMERMPSEFRTQMEELPAAERRRRLLFMAMSIRRPPGEGPMPSKEDFEKLVPTLSTATRASLDKIKSSDDKQQLVREWIRATMISKTVPPITDEQLQATYAELKEDQREYLESLDSDAMRRELTRIYYTEMMRRRGEGFSRGPFGPPGGREDGPRGPGPDRGGPPRSDGGRGDGGRGDGPGGLGGRFPGNRNPPGAKGPSGERPPFGEGPPGFPPPNKPEDAPQELPPRKPAADEADKSAE